MERLVTTKRITSENIIEYLLERLQMKKAGFIVDKKRNVYVKPGFGAWATNVSSYANMEYLRHSKCFDYINREGYNYVLGPGAPSKNGKVECMGLYLQNYEEVYDRQEEDRKTKVYGKR